MNDSAAALACAAARLVVEQGLEYADAKRKAARPAGRVPLPSDEAVEAEVRQHLALFCATTQPAELRALRRLALRWMMRLAAFRPHLSGAAWRGTATRRSSLHLDLYCDDPKAMQFALFDLGVEHTVGSLPAGRRGDPVSVFSLDDECPEWGKRVTLHLIVRDLDALRGALQADAQGRRWRGDASALQRLLDERLE